MRLGLNHTAHTNDLTEILARLKPHLPDFLEKIDSDGYRLVYHFTEFTGAEPRPEAPARDFHDDALGYVPKAQDPDEHALREFARDVLLDVYVQAYRPWRTAAYVADLTDAVQDAPDLWAAVQTQWQALEAAFTYLGTAKAAREWTSALFRLVEAQERTQAAADRFDVRARAIAEIHRKHWDAELGGAAALAKAGHPDAAAWPIAKATAYYTRDHEPAAEAPLAVIVRQRIEQQDTRIAKVARLADAR